VSSEQEDPVSENQPDDTSGDITDGVGTYDVVLLVEHKLSKADAAQVHSLHDEIEDKVVYHVLTPYDDAAARIEASMGSLAAGELLASPAMMMEPEDLEAVRKDSEDQAAAELGATLGCLKAEGCEVKGVIVHSDPIEALAATVQEVDAREAIILTHPHTFAEFFHMDWTSRARRKIGVPVLHLLEHETFDEQSGQGEGVTGL
jgi:hypothetical protein